MKMLNKSYYVDFFVGNDGNSYVLYDDGMRYQGATCITWSMWMIPTGGYDGN